MKEEKNIEREKKNQNYLKNLKQFLRTYESGDKLFDSDDPKVLIKIGTGNKGEIKKRKFTNLSSKLQRKLAKAIKRSRWAGKMLRETFRE